MSQPDPSSTAASRRARAALAGLIVLCGALPVAAWALRPVRIYEVDLEQQSVSAVQKAMREALVRATGRRESADDPAFAAVIADAARYVKSYASGPRGEPQVVFDAAAVAQAIDTAGRSVWDRERPFTLVVLYPPPGRADADAARAELEHTATERGLPISVIPLPVVDGGGNTLGAEALLRSAQRYGGDQVLVGRADAAGVAAGQLQWTLYTRAQSESWTGPLSAGIDHAVDLLAPPPGAAGSEAEVAARVRIEGVAGLADYAAVARLLQSIPGVRHAEVAELDSGSATFEIDMRGGSAALERELAGSTRLVRATSGPGPLVYRYRPQG
ncbi:MAG TPA: DUF2066 domain-containing protein [Steroidobacteraceae bacterium]|nr:DUF2066 domain-containing protein [Steroidobacteraceae bacterium]